MVMSAFIMGVILGELKYVLTRLGEQSVMIHGVTMMHVLFVDS